MPCPGLALTLDTSTPVPSDRDRDGDTSDPSGSGSDEGSGQEEELEADNWGPKTAPQKVSKQMVSFLKKHQRVDSKPVTCVLSKDMLKNLLQHNVSFNNNFTLTISVLLYGGRW